MTNLDIYDIQNKIGYKFKSWELLMQAFTHSSYANDNKVLSYERLEFLGDSILNYVIAEELYHRFSNKNEGFLSKARAKIVSAKTLCGVMDDMDVIKYLKAAECGASRNDARDSQAVRADLLEAIIGAISLDGGLASAKTFIKQKFDVHLSANLTNENITDYKSKFLERMAQAGKEVSFDATMSVRDGKDFFITCLTVNGKEKGRGEGFSKKKSEQLAAKSALDDIDNK